MSRPNRSLVVTLGLALLAALCLGGVSLATAAPVPMKQGPIASYSFDEGTGSTVEDLSGDGNTATIHGAEWTTHGRYGGAMEFHGGEGEYLSVPDSPELDFTEEFTLEAWVRPSTVENFYAPVVDKLAGGGGHTTTFSYGLYAGDWEHHPFGEVENPLGSGRSVTAPEPIEARTWTHLAFTFDGGKERLYVDGELVDETTADPPITTEGELEIGAETEHGDHLEGRIDEVRIYERALGAGEIALDMETPLQTPRTGPVADWSFDEGSGTTAADDTGNGHTATISKATWARGRFGNALKFDGKKSCVSVPNSAELDFTEELTLEAWVRPIGSGPEAGPLILQDDEAAGPTEEGYAYAFLAGENEVPKAWIREAGSGYEGIYGTEPLPENAWAHLALTDDGAHLRLYVDGELVRTAPAPPLTTGEGPLQIGCDPWGGRFEGRIDEMRLYDRALNGGEVDADMEAPIQTPKTGPIAAYSFDEGTGETVEDLSGDGHTATIQGAKWTTHGVYGGAMEFDAEEEDFLSIPASTGLDGTEQLTVEAWVRPTESPEWGSILMKERESGGPLYTYALYQHGEHAAGHFEESEAGVVASPEGSLPQGAWTHLAITDDGAWSRLYVNGELVDTEPALPLEGHGEIRIGGNEWWGEYFDGRIDEVRIYDRPLNGAEISTDVDTPLQTPETGPVAEYSFDAGTGSTLADVSGHENNGPIEGATWTPHGKYGSALEFNGSSSCVKVPNSESLQLGEEFTLEAWVRPEGTLSEDPIFFKENDPELGFWEIPSYWMDIGFNATGKPQGYTEGAMVTGPNSIHSGVWSHVAFTYDGHALHVYVNGELEAGNPIGGLAMSSKGPLYIGCAGAYEEFFHGRIDEARIYERALTWGEVRASSEVPIQTPRQGPIAAWSFDEGEGTTSEDVTGFGHEATLEGGPTWTKGKYGDALDFNGPTEKCAKVPDSPSLQMREDFTIEAWVRPVGTADYDPIIWKETGSAASYSLALGLSGGTKAEAYIGEEEGASYERAVSPSSIESNVWTHIAATYDGRHLRLYVNGELVDTTYTSTPNMASTGPLYIGCAPDFGEWFGGRIDDARIYERALTPAEVAASMGPLPSAQTAEAYGVEATEALFAAKIDPHGMRTQFRFEYGLTTAYGMTAPEAPSYNEQPESGNEPVEVEEWADELEPETTYHYRVVATSALGTVTGQDHTLTTGEATVESFAEPESPWNGNIGTNWNGINPEDLEPSKKMEIPTLVAESGAKIFRIPLSMCNTPPTAKEKEENKHGHTGAACAKTDELFLSFAKKGVKILPNLVGINVGYERPPYGNGKEIPPLGKESQARKFWKTELHELFDEYGPEGYFWTHKPGKDYAEYAPEWWEIWNEPNWGTQGSIGENVSDENAIGRINPTRFGQLLEATHEAVTETAQPVKILFGGVLAVGRMSEDPAVAAGETPHMRIKEFIEQVKHTDDYDALSLHPYAFQGSNACPDDPAQPCPPVTLTDVPKIRHKVQGLIANARGALRNTRKTAEEEPGGKGEGEKPIWVTELGWPVGGNGVEEDRSHRLVSEEIQAKLLTSTFDMIKADSAAEKTGGHPAYNIKGLLQYNIQDNAVGNPTPPRTEGPQSWDNHSGLVQSKGGVGEGTGSKRPAWTAFVKEAE